MSLGVLVLLVVYYLVFHRSTRPINEHPKVLLISLDGFRYDLLNETLVFPLIINFYHPPGAEYLQMGRVLDVVRQRRPAAVSDLHSPEPSLHCHRYFFIFLLLTFLRPVRREPRGCRQ